MKVSAKKCQYHLSPFDKVMAKEIKPQGHFSATPAPLDLLKLSGFLSTNKL